MRLVFIGASGHGKVCAEIAELNGNKEILFLDDDKSIKTCGCHPVMGVGADFHDYVDGNTQFFVSIGNGKARRRMISEIKDAGGKMAILIHPDSILSKDIQIGIGSVVMAGAVVNPGTVIGEGVIVNTGSSIDHDCRIGSYSHIAVGSHICGTVYIGGNCWIGAGAVVSNNVNICEGCMIGAGAIVIKDIDGAGTYIGVPAKMLLHKF